MHQKPKAHATELDMSVQIRRIVLRVAAPATSSALPESERVGSLLQELPTISPIRSRP